LYENTNWSSSFFSFTKVAFCFSFSGIWRFVYKNEMLTLKFRKTHTIQRIFCRQRLIERHFTKNWFATSSQNYMENSFQRRSSPKKRLEDRQNMIWKKWFEIQSIMVGSSLFTLSLAKMIIIKVFVIYQIPFLGIVLWQSWATCRDWVI